LICGQQHRLFVVKTVVQENGGTPAGQDALTVIVVGKSQLHGAVKVASHKGVPGKKTPESENVFDPHCTITIIFGSAPQGCVST
jgi:hypothetical protein